MARYVLIEIDDNAQAEAYVTSLREVGKAFVSVKDEDGSYRVVEILANVYGLYAKAVNFCQCETPGPVKRGERLGWWVCTKCNKPERHRWQMPNNLLEKHPGTHPRDATRGMHQAPLDGREGQGEPHIYISSTKRPPQ